MKTKQVREHKKERPRKEESKAKERKEKERKKKKRKENKEIQGSRLLSFEVCRKCTYPRGKVDAGSEWVPG